ncbi:helix-turn-helix domain-containing protein [Streptomyces sp. NPDC002763]|uniref:helix-turn-helix domain-containing protein n=1 Tax=Streptomyces sp. NPDC002763 TaxID=3154427 RepID=UPI00332FBFEA
MSLDSIAQTAGVTRRTLYGHFSSRQALVAELTREAGRPLQQAFGAAPAADAEPIEAMTPVVLTAWAVGDQYRMLISLGRRHLGAEAIHATLAPAREEAPGAGSTAADPRRGERRAHGGGPHG